MAWCAKGKSKRQCCKSLDVARLRSAAFNRIRKEQPSLPWSSVHNHLKKIRRRIKNPYVFPGEKPGKARTDLPKSWEPSLQKAGIQDFHWHDLRHTFASRLMMKGAELYEVMRLLGHTNIETTQRYAHLSPKHLQGVVALLNKSTQ